MKLRNDTGALSIPLPWGGTPQLSSPTCLFSTKHSQSHQPPHSRPAGVAGVGRGSHLLPLHHIPGEAAADQPRASLHHAPHANSTNWAKQTVPPHGWEVWLFTPPLAGPYFQSSPQPVGVGSVEANRLIQVRSMMVKNSVVAVPYAAV